MTPADWYTLALVVASVGVLGLGVWLLVRKGDWRVVLALLAAGLSGLVVALLRKGARGAPKGVTDPILLPRIVGRVAEDQIVSRWKIDRDAIAQAGTDPDAGVSLADIANADAARRLRKTTRDAE